jgi:tRNA modification GTPase
MTFAKFVTDLHTSEHNEWSGLPNSAGLIDDERVGVLGDPVNPVSDSFGAHISVGPRASIARVLTAPGAGAVAVIAVSLNGRVDTASVFGRFVPVPERDMGHLPMGRIVFGSWGGEDIVIVRTSLGEWEIHCHGGLIAVSRILADLQAAGVELASPRNPESLAPAGLAEATLQILLQCRTRKTASLVLGHLDGRLERLLAQMQSGAPEVKASAVQHVSRWRDVAEHLAKPWRVAFVGPPNAGKSSLINALAGLQRSIVSSTPGTTRDVVEVDVIIDGWMFQLIDTAGIRMAAQSAIEEVGIENALLAADDCDLLCMVLDVTQPALEPRVLERLTRRKASMCLVENKIDLSQSGSESLQQGRTGDAAGRAGLAGIARLPVSAVTSDGLPELLRWIVRSAVPEEPTAETVLPLTSQFQ